MEACLTPCPPPHACTPADETMSKKTKGGYRNTATRKFTSFLTGQAQQLSTTSADKTVQVQMRTQSYSSVLHWLRFLTLCGAAI